MDSLFITINQWITSSGWIAALGCFLWGMISVLFSPCHLASIPLIVAYVGGQNELVHGKRAVKFALLFSIGLFITIAIIGIICTLLGRMLGDIGPYWTIFIGAILLMVALDMLGMAKSMPGSMMGRIRLKGAFGAFILGLAYGMLSGSCTFGFIAPILAIITVQEQITTGVMLIVLFGLGHCLPIAVAGSSTAIVKKLLENSFFGQGAIWFRKGAGLLIAGLGLYFIALPFV
jgi:cytochrome c-type biogenesis protein